MEDRDPRLARAKAHHRAGQIELAEPVYRQISEEDDECGDAWHMLGVIELQRGNLSQAESLIGKAIALDDENAKYYINLANVFVLSKRVGEGEEMFRRALEMDGELAEAHYGLANALRDLKRPGEAVAAYRQAIALDGNYADAYNNLAMLLKELGREKDMETVLLKARDKFPDNPAIMWNYCDYLEHRNRIDEAYELAQHLLKNHSERPESSLMMARLDFRKDRFRNAAVRLRALVAKCNDPAIKLDAYFELGRSLDRMGDAAWAFQAFRAGNELQAESCREKGISGKTYRDLVARMEDWFTKDRLSVLGKMQETPTDGRPDPVFFVGFPRSGTTLAEQMLGSHDNIVTTDERSPISSVKKFLFSRLGVKEADYPACLAKLTPGDWAGARQSFWREAEKTTGADLTKRRLVDKLPLHLVELGLINMLFSNAKVLVALRDPRDVALSCFMQQFRPNTAMANFNTLGDTARFYGQIMGLWRHYRTHMPAAWHEYRYEDLTDDFTAVSRSILDFIGEPWSDEILGFQERALERSLSTPSYRDVASPLYDRAIGRWRNYAEPMAAILPTLEPFVELFGYEAG